jgi:hypothetical protein
VGRVINPESAGKERTRLTKGIVLAMRGLMRQTEPNEESQDLAAFIALALLEIAEGIDTSVLAWEKKGYWVKADRFRMEWDWSARLGDQMRQAVLNNNWAEVARVAVQVGGKLKDVKVSEHHRLGTPWIGAYRKLATKVP